MTHQQTRASVRARLLSTSLVAFACAASTSASALRAQDASSVTLADREAVKRAVLDYVEGFYEGDSAKLARSVRPEVYKYGFWKARDSTRYSGQQMTWPEFFAYARRIKQNNRQAPATAPKRIELYDVLDQTASAKLTAFWGIDYLLLAKYNGKWMISSVMWQSLPPQPARTGGGGGGDSGGSGGDGSEENAVEPFENDLLATDNVFRGTFAPDGANVLLFPEGREAT